ncbi:MAG: hypothetical protein HXX13_12750 [Bacteroidetes bacterium]|nr:hypothetical protein [Bacteroidota bacterium]
MNGAHFHLLVNHVPIIGTIFGMLILFVGVILKNSTVKLTGLGTLIFAALSSSVALMTGDPAEETIQGLAGVSNALIQHHETIAYSSLWILIPMGILAALAMYSIWKKERSGNVLAVITLVFSFAAIGMMSWTGLTGGEIRHTEIRSQSVGDLPVEKEKQELNEND